MVQDLLLGSGGLTAPISQLAEHLRRFVPEVAEWNPYMARDARVQLAGDDHRQPVNCSFGEVSNARAAVIFTKPPPVDIYGVRRPWPPSKPSACKRQDRLRNENTDSFSIGKLLNQAIPCLSLFVMWFATVVVFSLSRAAGDPRYLFVSEYSTQEQWDEWGVRFGLDRPYPMQYLIWLGKAVQVQFRRIDLFQ